MSFRFLALVASELLIAVVLSVMLPVGALGASCGRGALITR
jgi:hypothetical protein